MATNQYGTSGEGRQNMQEGAGKVQEGAAKMQEGLSRAASDLREQAEQKIDQATQTAQDYYQQAREKAGEAKGAIQDRMERTLAATREKYAARSATGIVMDPRTGAVLAMATVPRFNPSRL